MQRRPDFEPLRIANTDIIPLAGLLAKKGIKFEAGQSENGRTIVASYAGFTRRLTANPNQEVRVITDPQTIQSISGKPGDSDLLLATIAARNQISISRLCQEPPAGVTTQEFITPREGSNVAVAADIVDSVESNARRQLEGQRKNVFGYVDISFPEGTLPRDEKLGIDGRYLIREGESGRLEWYFPKMTKMKQTPLRQVLRENGMTDQEQFETATELILQAPVVVEKQDPNEKQKEFFAQVLRSANPEVTAFLSRLDTAENSGKKGGRDHADGEEELNGIKKRLLVEAGLQLSGNPPFDQVAQGYLPDARRETQLLGEGDLLAYLKDIKSSDSSYYKKMMRADLPTQREVVAWNTAKERVGESLIVLAAREARTAELEEAYKIMNKPAEVRREPVFHQNTIDVVDVLGERIPSSEFFRSRVESPFTIDQWAELPTRPVTLPLGKPEPGDTGLAEYLFDQIIYSPQVCEKNGTQVGLSPEVRQKYIDRIAFSVRLGIPIVATEYLPMIAVGNPLKRNTQDIALAEIDYFRRLAETSHAIEMYYNPGMLWLLGNEGPAFQGPKFSLNPDYVAKFNSDAEAVVQKIDPKGKRIQFFNMADLLWGTPDRYAKWKNYERERSGEIREALADPAHPEHADMTGYINTFIYPMATCINPYKLDEAQGLSMQAMMQTYGALRRFTGTQFRGVDISNDEGVGLESLSAQQRELLHKLHDWGTDISILYRTEMDARDVLPAFKEFIPPNVLGNTIISKRDKLVRYPNSGKGPVFPAHGEPVLLRSQNSGQRTAVTVRPWWQIVAEKERYQPAYVAGRREPLYFEEVK